MANNKINIDNFLLSITNMLESKYILVDRKISDILLSIADTRDVYNLIAECMINFDFKEEWKNATSTNIMKLPAGDEKRISFIFCFLNNIDDKNLDITNILEKYFSYDKTCSPYELFCRNIILEFRRLVLKKLNLLSEEEMIINSTDESQQYGVDDEFSVLSKLIKENIEFIANQKKIKHIYLSKNDLIAVLSTFDQVVLNKQIEYFYSYQIMINLAIEKNKLLKNRFTDINKMIDIVLKGSV